MVGVAGFEIESTGFFRYIGAEAVYAGLG